MIRSYRYQLRPTCSQAAVLVDWLNLTRELYNAALQERREAWAKQRVSISYYDQQRALLTVREVRPEFENVPIIVMRGAVRRLDKAFKAFFRRCKSGETPGFPRFKNKDRWSSLLIDDLGGKCPIVAGGKRVSIPLLGKIKFKQHRPLEGVPKAMRITRDVADRWFVTFACVDVPQKLLPKTEKEIGIDLGLMSFVATSDGSIFENPRHLNDARLRLERAQRRVSGRTKGSRRRRKAAKLLARHHARVVNLRRESHIVIAKTIVFRADRIYVEDLSIKKMIEQPKSRLSRSIADAAWGNFLHWLNVKAEEAGREVIEVNPHGTSQMCSGCGAVVRKDLSVRIHDCPFCGLRVDRDVNASRNILRLGRSLQGVAPLVEGRRRSAKSMRQGGLSNG